MVKHSIKALPVKKIASHRELNAVAGQKIPKSKLTKSLFSVNPKMRKQTITTRTLSGLRK